MRAKVKDINPAYVSLKDAMKYTGMKRFMFTQAASGLTLYAFGKRKTFYKVSELDQLMESLIIKKRTA